MKTASSTTTGAVRIAPRDLAVGLAAGAVVVAIWTAFLLVSRAGVLGPLLPTDIAGLRMSVAFVAAAPIAWRFGLAGLRPYQAAVVTATAGLGFPLLAYWGFAFAPAAHASIMMTSTLPLWTALLARLVLGEPQETAAAEGEGVTADRVTVLEAAVDDMNPEWFGYLMERLFEEGALDVLWIPVQMKKNRPGTLIQVLCRPEQAGRLARRVLTESTTLGVRLQAAERLLLSREIVTVGSSFGAVPMKRVVGPGGTARLVPEFEACREIARSRRIPLREVYERLLREAGEHRPEGPAEGPPLA